MQQTPRSHRFYRRLHTLRWQLGNIWQADPSLAKSLRGRPVNLSAPLDLRPKELLLTFDDGPHASVTAEVLKALAEFDVSAVFFLIGSSVQAFPDIVRRTEREGHIVASHTLTHAALPRFPIDAARQEVRGGHAALGRALGHPAPPFFRFPFLLRSPELDAMLNEEGLTAFGGVMPRDWDCATAEEVVGGVLYELERRQEGCILLLHDVHWQTGLGLPLVLAELGRRGYSFVTPIAGPAAR